MLKIAILGKAGSGKNTIASLIANEILQLQEKDYLISAFATKIKEATTLLFPNCNKEELYGPSELRQNIIDSDLNKYINISATYREVTLDVGKLGRKYNSYFWVGHIANEYFKIKDKIKLYIIADARFEEEVKWLKDNKFMLCRVKRDNLIEINDVSETSQNYLTDDQFDIIINNNCSIIELKQQLTHLLDKYFNNNMTYLQVRNAAI